ncbi:YcaO-like family protein [Streptomyces sp. NPDC058614]|uniref:YcaO-like family protein n=1 Tax=Streptomyces sp. NPDC058614 TaxID=3346557 RepID=UPI0036645392
MKALTSILKLGRNGWLSPTAGPISHFWCRSLGYPDPRWWIFGATLARAPFGTYWSRFDFSAAGASIDRREALARTIGEALERHASMHSLSEDIEVIARFQDSLLSNRFPRCSDAETCPPMFKGHNWDTPVGHVRMQAVASDDEVLVPTPYAHLGYMAPTAELLATYPISTGTAFAENRITAQWRALCEVAERDAIMLFWLTRTRFSRVEVDFLDGPPTLLSRLHRVREVDLNCSLIDITTEFRVPTVLAILTGSEYPFTTVGASCQADPVRACCKAIDEAVSVRYSLRHDRWKRDIPSHREFSWVRRLEDHMALYGSWRDSPAISFVWNAPCISLGNFAAQFDEWIPRSDIEFQDFTKRLWVDLRLTVLRKELTTADIGAYGHVMKIVVPEMLPLSQDHNARWLETERLKRRMRDASTEINEFPHPFA